MIESKKLMLIGGGGHCYSIIDSIFALGKYDDIGIVDNVDVSYYDVPVIGTDQDIPSLIAKGWNEAFVSVGSIGDTSIRRKIYIMLKAFGLNVATIIDPSAIIAKDIIIGEGSFIGKKSVINAGCTIGKCVIVNSGALIEHECSIGDFSHISPGAVLCGRVRVGSDSHIGAGAVVRQSTLIGNDVLIGIGSSVVRDIPNGVKAFGNPCRVINK